MIKRVFDFVAACLGLVIQSPVFVLIALWVKLDSPGPVFYRGERVGKDGRLFRICKFRTMVAQAALAGPGITTKADRRVTRVGKFLRRTKLDELPQLMNVLCGEMSLVGPRPEDPRYVAFYTPEQRRVLSVRPGMTSLASVRYRDESSLLTGDDWERLYIEQIMPHKLAIEIEYLQHSGPWSDMQILLRTLWALCPGASSQPGAG
jgi:lipopolysaccharide/colanic/teichoic acid biosynthesis glycosyltransferase